MRISEHVRRIKDWVARHTSDLELDLPLPTDMHRLSAAIETFGPKGPRRP